MSVFLSEIKCHVFMVHRVYALLLCVPRVKLRDLYRENRK